MTNCPIQKRWRWAGVLAAGASVLLGGMGGCAGGLELGAFSASTSIVETGATMFTRGRVLVFEEASTDAARSAARRAVKRLELRIDREQEDDDALRLYCVDRLNAAMMIVIETRTPAIVRIKTDAGLWGNPSFASLVLVTIRDEIQREQNAPDRDAPSATRPAE